jgi:antitoxin MazE
MRVVKWGNSLAVRLPCSVVETLKLKEGDEINITIAGSRFARDRRREPALKKLRARCRRYSNSTERRQMNTKTLPDTNVLVYVFAHIRNPFVALFLARVWLLQHRLPLRDAALRDGAIAQKRRHTSCEASWSVGSRPSGVS